MKLYDSKLSPYANRVRLQLYLKGIDAQLIDVPQGGSHTAEYAKMNPLEKIPTLDDGGFYLPESGVIGEYIEDTRPTPSLRPTDAKERAKMRVMFNIADQYILNPLFELFEQIDPKLRNAAVVDEQLTELAKGLKGLEHFIVPGKYAMGANASLADCALVPLARWDVELDADTLFQPELRLNYRRELIGDRFETMSEFVGAPGLASFNTQGVDPARDILDLGIGALLATAGGVDVRASYDLELKDDYTAHGGYVRASVAF